MTPEGLKRFYNGVMWLIEHMEFTPLERVELYKNMKNLLENYEENMKVLNEHAYKKQRWEIYRNEGNGIKK